MSGPPFDDALPAANAALGEALALAQAAGLRVRFDDLGDWSPAALFSEYDPAGRSIAVNARIVRSFRERFGAAFAARFAAAAIVHELHHHNKPGDAEAAADAAVRARGFEPDAFAEALRIVRDAARG